MCWSLSSKGAECLGKQLRGGERFDEVSFRVFFFMLDCVGEELGSMVASRRRRHLASAIC